MLKRIGDIVDEGANLLEARAQVLLQRLKRTGVLAAGYVGAAILLSAGALTLVAALTVWVAEQLGTAAALAISGALLVGIALGVALFLRAWWSKPDEQEKALTREVQAAREAFRTALKGKDEPSCETAAPSAAGLFGNLFGGMGGLGGKLGGVIGSMGGLWKNPAVLIGGALVVVSLLAKPRTMKLFTRLIGAAGMTSTIMATLRQVRQAVDDARVSAAAHAASNGAAGAHVGAHREPDQPV